MFKDAFVWMYEYEEFGRYFSVGLFFGIIYMFTLVVIPTERSEWRNLLRDVSTSLDMTSVYPFTL